MLRSDIALNVLSILDPKEKWPAPLDEHVNIALYHGVATSNWIMGGGGNWDSTGWFVTQGFTQTPVTYYYPEIKSIPTRIIARVRNNIQSKTTRVDNYLQR